MKRKFKKIFTFLSLSSFFCLSILAKPQLKESERLIFPYLEILEVEDFPDPFSPNNDGISDTIEIKAKISLSGFDKHKGKKEKEEKLMLQWKVIIRDDRGRLIRNFVDTQKVSDDSQIEVFRVWDGRDSEGNIVKDSTYFYEFQAKIKDIKAEPKAGEVTVNTQLSLSVSVFPDTWVIGEHPPYSVITMTESEKITVLNDGVIPATYSLNLIDPLGWQSSQNNVCPDTYILNAAFSQSLANIAWNEEYHALLIEPVLCSDVRFAGDETGVNVAPNQGRTLWLQFKAPSATSIGSQQEIKVVISAQNP